MSLLDGKKLLSHGDQLPRSTGKKLKYRDGVKHRWTFRQAQAIRALAEPNRLYSLKAVAKAVGISIKLLKRWMGNPYFMLEVQKLADHMIFRYRPKVLGAVAKRAIGGNPQMARLYLQATGDLRDEQYVKQTSVSHQVQDGLENMDDNEVHEKLLEEMGYSKESIGDYAERVANRAHEDS